MNTLDLMNGLTVYHLRFEVRAREYVHFGPQPGAALRGALYHALSGQYCPDRQAVHLPGHQAACPVCWLLATEDPTGSRGRDVPRPLTIEPPTTRFCAKTGECWGFGVSLIGSRALEASPHIVRAVQTMGEAGVGNGRGRFELTNVEEVNPLSRMRVSLLNGRQVCPPSLPVTTAQILTAAAHLPGNLLTLHFITPLRIGEQKRLAHTPNLGIFLRRLIDRCQAMATHFGNNQTAYERTPWSILSNRLSQVAEKIRLTHNGTRWLDVKSSSRRSGSITPIGGLVGTATWEGELSEAIPWVLWGQSLHVGKNAVKGNGWYEVKVS